ncbi:HesA/MoeB/ThiF family protein [Paenibacillus eucommiae]|uniref:Molybdopterin/thiamine biosynthesis adenylyltransferase n=1 Tax=Paenibacillus eucommiae TaxID=1355755 RepID=A0ABS4IPV3_9BACL|nr:ThiF family adenylyltransferase [Paenibacillus eucommiae]MBP1989598.1 molybdopterin/thiamine biosynthesis adenylyltransferase [Paenibacillus eucommiae]
MIYKLKDHYRRVMTYQKDTIRIVTEYGPIEIPDSDGKIVAFLKLLDGNKRIEELSKFLSISVAEIELGIRMLLKFRLLECLDSDKDKSVFSDSELLRYKNNLSYFSLYETESESRYTFQSRLKSTTVAIIGLGGGSVIAAWLASMGVGKIIGIDYDIVEIGNLNRQMLYTEADVGRLKTDVVKERLHMLNSDTVVETIDQKVDSTESILKVLRGADIVVGAIDWPLLYGSRFVNTACLRENKPLFFAGLRHGSAFIHRILPYQTGCADCFWITSLRSNESTLSFVNDVINGVHTPQINPAFAPNIALLTSLVGSEIAKYITKHSPIFPNPYTRIRLHDTEISHHEVPRLLECPSCGSHVANLNEPTDLMTLITLSVQDDPR